MQRKLISGIIAIFLCVLVIQFMIAAIQPYLSWIGRTAAIVICVLMVLAVIASIIMLVRLLLNRFGGGGTFNG